MRRHCGDCDRRLCSLFRHCSCCDRNTDSLARVDRGRTEEASVAHRSRRSYDRQHRLAGGSLEQCTGLVQFSGRLETRAETDCIRCGRCVSVCPHNLAPLYLSMYGRRDGFNKCRKYHIESCSGCGCCDYVCPSGIPLTENIISARDRMNSAVGNGASYICRAPRMLRRCVRPAKPERTSKVRQIRKERGNGPEDERRKEITLGQ